MARALAYEPGKVDRRTEPVDVEKLDALHAKLRNVSVVLKPEPTSQELRALFSEIRRNRTMVSRIFGIFLPRVARYRADALRVESALAAETAQIMFTGQGLALTKNEKQRTSRIRTILSDLYEQQVQIKEDLLALEVVVSHTKHVHSELRDSFEEASRSLAALDMEYRLERSAP